MIEKILIIVCILCIFAGLKGYLNYSKYKKDEEGTKKVIEFFKKHGKDGINPKDIPKEIINTGYISWMKKDKILSFKDGKYYLNK